MSVEMTIVSNDTLDKVLARLASLEKKLDAVQLTAPPRWITIGEYAIKTGKSESTVQRHIRNGLLDVNHASGTRMVPNPEIKRYG